MTTAEPALMLGAVGVVDSRIALVSQDSQEIELFEAQHTSLRRIDCGGKILMPGLINTHTHVAMTLQRGMGDDVELMPWLNNIVWPFEARQSEEDIEAGATLGIAEMLLGGTTTFVDMYWHEHAIAKAVERLGIRALLGESCMEGVEDIFEERLSKLVESATKCDRITAVVAPHAPYTCPPQIMELCRELAQRYNLPLTTHLAETRSEVETIEKLYNLTPTQYLESCGMITPSTILAHSIYLTEEDIEIIERHGAHIAHNPQCNMKISSGVAPIPQLMETQVTTTIGTDGVCSNNDLDMWDEMRTASLLHKLSAGSPTVLPAYEILKMTTVNAAKAIGRQGELGVIAQGALADIVVLNTNRIHYRPHHDLVSSIIYCGKASDVEHVMVNGTLLVEEYQLTGVDIESICLDVESRSRAIVEAMGSGAGA